MRVLTRVALPLLLVSLLGACASVPRGNGGYSNAPAWPDRGSQAQAATGVITGIEVSRDGGAPDGTGAVIGGLIGAVVGRGISSDNTGGYRQRNIATALGAVLGAAAGHQVERFNKAAGYRVTVSLDRGGSVTLDQRDLGDLRVGDRVRVDQDRVVRQSAALPSYPDTRS